MFYVLAKGSTMVQWLTVLPQQIHDPQLNSKLRILSIQSFHACSPSVHVGFLRFPPTSQKLTSRWNGYNKLPLGINYYVNVCVHCVLQWTGVSFRVFSTSCPVFPE